MVRNWFYGAVRCALALSVAVAVLFVSAGEASAQRCGAGRSAQSGQGFRPVRNFIERVQERRSGAPYGTAGGCSVGCSGASSARAPEAYGVSYGAQPSYGAPVVNPVAGTVAVFDGSTWRHISTDPAPVVQATHYRPEPAPLSLPTWAARAPSGHTHTCANGHTWDHSVTAGHNCPVRGCGLAQFVQDGAPRPVTAQGYRAAPYSLPVGGCANGKCQIQTR